LRHHGFVCPLPGEWRHPTRAHRRWFPAAFTELREGVEEHVDMEEDELMPALAAALGSELDRLGSQLEARKEQLMAGKA
jgi:hypothetical protein